MNLYSFNKVNDTCSRFWAIFALVGLSCLSGSPALADNWNYVVQPDNLPKRVVTVDKGRQQLHVFNLSNQLEKSYDSTCTTGQKTGAKEISGDLRTPEGLYFVVGKISAKLDFMEYGDIAYALNYPNPIDRLDGKTGHGIWIHSRGRAITPTETRGCVAVNLDDMDRLAAQLATGTPVILAETVETATTPKSADTAAVLALLERKTRQWNTAWASRESGFFDFYDNAAYTKAQGEPFTAFKSLKERLFNTLPWIHIIYGDIQVMQGPDYWVTWFNQYYRAPNLATEGVRRLYWRTSTSGELRIVGMEWIPQNLGMETAYLENITPGVTAFIEDWRGAWEKGDVDAYLKFYAADARQTPRQGVASIEQHKRTNWSKKRPKVVKLNGIRVKMLQNGVSVDMTQEYQDSSGYKDRGVKTILLYPKGTGWVIAQEDWSALPK